VTPNLTTHPLLEESVGGKGEVPATGPVPAAPPKIFRAQALAAQQRGGVVGEPLRIAPVWATWAVILVSIFVAVALAGACFARVEVTSLGRGIMQSKGPPQILASQIAGVAVSVSVHPGEKVVAGQEIARLESATTAAALLEARRKLDVAVRSLQNFREQQQPLHRARLAQQAAQVRSLHRRAESENDSVWRMAQKAKALDSLRGEGLATVMESTDVAEQAEAARRAAMRALEERAHASEQIAVTSADMAAEEWNLLMQIEDARARCDSIQFALDAAVVRAPSAGVVGSMAVRPGDSLQVGAFVARIVSDGAPRTVVVYLPERDRAFVDPGSRVRVELDQLPVWEFGALVGSVTRVSSEMASERDLRDTLGDQVKLLQEPMYRVDVTLDEDAVYSRFGSRLRPESLANVRFTLRTRRVITVLFEPLKRWLN
jgi:multidrug resistance efflux pump